MVLHVWKSSAPPKQRLPWQIGVIIDGAAIVQVLHPKNSRSFSEYALDVFIPYITLQFCNASHLDLVWDRYVEDSLKGTARAKYEKGVCWRLVAEGVIPKIASPSFE